MSHSYLRSPGSQYKHSEFSKEYKSINSYLSFLVLASQHLCYLIQLYFSGVQQYLGSHHCWSLLIYIGKHVIDLLQKHFVLHIELLY